jgi:hypothetical protein
VIGVGISVNVCALAVTSLYAIFNVGEELVLERPSLCRPLPPPSAKPKPASACAPISETLSALFLPSKPRLRRSRQARRRQGARRALGEYDGEVAERMFPDNFLVQRAACSPASRLPTASSV